MGGQGQAGLPNVQSLRPQVSAQTCPRSARRQASPPTPQPIRLQSTQASCVDSAPVRYPLIAFWRRVPRWITSADSATLSHHFAIVVRHQGAIISRRPGIGYGSPQRRTPSQYEIRLPCNGSAQRFLPAGGAHTDCINAWRNFPVAV